MGDTLQLPHGEGDRVGGKQVDGLNLDPPGPGSNNSFGIIAQLADEGLMEAEATVDPGGEDLAGASTHLLSPTVPQHLGLDHTGRLPSVKVVLARGDTVFDSATGGSLNALKGAEDGDGPGLKRGRKPLGRARLFAKAARLEQEKRRNASNFRAWRDEDSSLHSDSSHAFMESEIVPEKAPSHFSRQSVCTNASEKIPDSGQSRLPGVCDNASEKNPVSNQLSPQGIRVYASEKNPGADTPMNPPATGHLNHNARPFIPGTIDAKHRCRNDTEDVVPRGRSRSRHGRKVREALVMGEGRWSSPSVLEGDSAGGGFFLVDKGVSGVGLEDNLVDLAGIGAVGEFAGELSDCDTTAVLSCPSWRAQQATDEVDFNRGNEKAPAIFSSGSPAVTVPTISSTSRPGFSSLYGDGSSAAQGFFPPTTTAGLSSSSAADLGRYRSGIDGAGDAGTAAPPHGAISASPSMVDAVLASDVIAGARRFSGGEPRVFGGSPPPTVAGPNQGTVGVHNVLGIMSSAVGGVSGATASAQLLKTPGTAMVEDMEDELPVDEAELDAMEEAFHPDFLELVQEDLAAAHGDDPCAPAPAKISSNGKIPIDPKAGFDGWTCITCRKPKKKPQIPPDRTWVRKDNAARKSSNNMVPTDLNCIIIGTEHYDKKRFDSKGEEAPEIGTKILLDSSILKKRNQQSSRVEGKM
ncbi:hypothetical protein KSP40_PGU005398 [Platanthera guangdongensis]|uniref:Uncharacterized protein n=1 Tax=Platanthera guangdongensis TaxID=2320717 RepID=A0ABR2M2K4_9ASPA